MTLSLEVLSVCATFSAVECKAVARRTGRARGASAAAQPASATILSMIAVECGLWAAMTCLRVSDALYAKIQ